MSKYVNALGVVLSFGLMTLPGCSLGIVKDMHLSGKLVYYLGDVNVVEVDLSTGEKRVIYMHDSLLDGDIARVGNAMVVVDLYGEMYYVWADGRSHRLRRGSEPVYMPKHRKLLFMYRAKGRHETSLYEARLDEGVIGPAKEISRGPIGAHSVAPSVLPVSEHEVVFNRNGGALFKHDLRDGEITELPVSGCDPLAWRSATAQVLCWHHDAPGAFLVSLNGRDRTEIPELAQASTSFNLYPPIIGPYVPTRDGLLVTDGRFFSLREVSDLYLYDFSHETFHRIAEDVSFVTRQAFYAEDW